MRPHPHAPVSPTITAACPNCGGPDMIVRNTPTGHATWCNLIPAHGDTVLSVAAEQAQADADVYDDYQHGNTIEHIAKTERMTWTSVYAAIARHRRRLANQPEPT